jgi:hypothetical protein
MQRDKVLKIESLAKIRIQQVMNDDGWEKYFNNQKIILNPVLINEQTFLELIWNNMCLGRFRVVEHTIGQLPYIKEKKKNEHGEEEETFRPRSPMLLFCVLGADGKRYRALYFQALPDGRFLIGTRTDLHARYTAWCLSRKQRNSPEKIAMRLAREKKYERKLRRRMFGKNGFFRDRNNNPVFFHRCNFF